MSSPHAARLLADIGGTNARFAWQAGPGTPIEDIRTLSCASFPCIEAAIDAYLNQIDRPRPRIAAIAIANPVYGDEIRMTNHHWSFSIRELRRAMNWEHLEVLNDFTALALALPTLPDSQRRLTGGGAPAPDSAIGLIGPGTGLGVSGLLPDGRGGWIPLQGEGGHATLAAITPKERIVVRALQQRHQHVSAERAISGMGLEDIYSILCQAAHQPPSERKSAAEISQAALSGDALAKEALMMMCAFLGTVAGNLALTLGARGGVYIGGGIIPKLGVWFDQSPFRERFESKGRFRSYLKDIPVWVITADQSPALAGAAAQLDRLESFHRE